MNLQKTARRITATLLATQSLESAASSVTGTVNTIIGAQLSGITALAGLPGAVVQLGSAVAAMLLGATMDRWGRRITLTFGIGLGTLGCGIAVYAIANQSFILFLAGLSLFGFSRAAGLMGRFVAAEVNPPGRRGRAISYVILGGTFGSVLGPQLAGPSGAVAVWANLNELAGPYLIGSVAFGFGAAVLFLFLRPEPRDIGKMISDQHPDLSIHSGQNRAIIDILRTPSAMVAVIAMVFGQVVMVGLMGITSLHMANNQHGLGAISLVFSSHTLGMFAFSILTGKLVDSWGRGRVIIAGAGMLLLSSIFAPISTRVGPMALALFLLGLGWNFCFVGGSTLLSDILSPEERAKTQGVNDLLISLMTAFASFSSGVVFSIGGYSMTGVIGALVALIPLTAAGWWLLQPKEKIAVP